MPNSGPFRPAGRPRPCETALRYDPGMPEQSDALRPVPGSGRSFLGVRRMTPHDDGVHLFDDAGAEVAVVGYGERVYINGRVISFTEPKPS